MENKLLTKILCVLALIMLFVILLYNFKSSPDYADDAIGLNVNVSQESDQPSSSTTPSILQSQLGASTQSNPTTTLWFDLNTVTYEQLCQIDGIGDVKATAILEMRKKVGRFDNLDQLTQIKGIGDKTLEKLTQYLYIQ